MDSTKFAKAFLQYEEQLSEIRLGLEAISENDSQRGEMLTLQVQEKFTEIVKMIQDSRPVVNVPCNGATMRHLCENETENSAKDEPVEKKLLTDANEELDTIVQQPSTSLAKACSKMNAPSLMNLPDLMVERIFERTNMDSATLKTLRLSNTRLARILLPQLIDESRFTINADNAEQLTEFMLEPTMGTLRPRMSRVKRLTLVSTADADVTGNGIPLRSLLPMFTVAKCLKELVISGHIVKGQRWCLVDIDCSKLVSLKILGDAFNFPLGFFNPSRRTPFLRRLKHIYLHGDCLLYDDASVEMKRLGHVHDHDEQQNQHILEAAQAFQHLESLALADLDLLERCYVDVLITIGGVNWKTLLISIASDNLQIGRDGRTEDLAPTIATSCNNLTKLHFMGMYSIDDLLKELTKIRHHPDVPNDGPCCRTSLKEIEYTVRDFDDEPSLLDNMELTLPQKQQLNNLPSLKAFNYVIPLQHYVDFSTDGLPYKFECFFDSTNRAIESHKFFSFV